MDLKLFFNKKDTKNEKPIFLQIVIIMIFALAFPVITFVIYTNPSGMPPASPFSNKYIALILILISFVIIGTIYYILLNISNSKLFISTFSITFSIITAGTIYSSLVLHRDYFTHIFQIIIIYWLIYVYKSDLFISVHSKKKFYSSIFRIDTFIFAAFSVWIIVMGYAIATRQEPRWAESIIYNAYNLILVILLGVSSLDLKLKRFRKIRIINKKLYIDNWNFTQFFTDIEKEIIIQFLKTESNLTCSALEFLVSKDSRKQTENSNKWDCSICLEKEFTATQCPKYKKLYNRILNIKKLFETLEIGSIIAPENKMQIKQIGWKLRLFDDVRVVHHLK